MAQRNRFPAIVWIWRTLTGRIARRVYGTVLCMLLLASTIVRISSYVLTRRIQAVISGLSKLQIDETDEDELLRTVPRLVRGAQDRDVHSNDELGNVEEGVERDYHAFISNERSWMRFEEFAWRCSSVESSKDGRQRSWVFAVANLLGYRYVGFRATVVLLHGRVSSVRYGIGEDLGFPGPDFYVVSIRSVHARWASHRTDFEISSAEDGNLQFSAEGDDRHLSVVYSPDAASPLKVHLFQVNLRCFWALIRCDQARQLVPLLWHDKNSMEAAALARLKSNDPCPDSILAGRARYLPDINVLLLRSMGFESKDASEGGHDVHEIWTHYKLIEVLRGRAWGSWEFSPSNSTIPYPGDYTRKLPNTGLQWAKAGDMVLAFSGYFDSCRLVPATPSALSAVRDTVPATRRAEDETVRGLR